VVQEGTENGNSWVRKIVNMWLRKEWKMYRIVSEIINM
jgi:hypothetical protein